MGVYNLYAPIFSYKLMEENKQPRLYSRRNDQVDLDNYISTLESGLDDWISKRGLSSKDEELVRGAYSQMVNRLNAGDDSFIYTGNGFRDEHGSINGNSKAFKTAASYLGQTLRKLTAYKKPEPKKDPKALEYSDEAVSGLLRKQLFGPANTQQDFLDLDTIDKNTNIRANTNRSKYFKSAISNLVADLRTGNGDSANWTPEQRNKKADELESLYSIFDNDGVITDNEYLQLAKITGMKDLRDLFSTNGTQESITAGNAEEDTEKESNSEENSNSKEKSKNDINEYLKWVYENYAPYTGELSKPFSMGNLKNITFQGPYTMNTFLNGLRKKSTEDLQKALLRALSSKNLKTKDEPLVKSIFTDKKFNPKIKSTTYLYSLLNELSTREGGLDPFNDNTDRFYIPHSNRTDRNTAFIWDKKNNSINEMSIHDIPAMQQYIMNKWKNLQNGIENNVDPEYSDLYTVYNPIFSNKKGGVLKFKEGNVMNRNQNFGGIRSDNNPFLNVDNTKENAKNLDLWDTYYNNFGIDNDLYTSGLTGSEQYYSNTYLRNRAKPSFDDLLTGNFDVSKQRVESSKLIDNTKKFWDYGYQLDANGNRIKDGNGNDTFGISGAQLAAYLNELNNIGSKLSWNKKLDDTGYLDWNKKFDQTGLNMYFGSDTDRFDLMGPSTWNRHGFLQNLAKQHTGENNSLNVNGGQIYFDGNQWKVRERPIKKVDPKDLINPNPIINIPKLNIEKLPNGAKKLKLDTTHSFIPEGGGSDSDDKKNKFDFSTYQPYLSDAARLYKSLQYNRKIRDTMNAAMHPVLYQPYETYTPVTGAFDQLQLGNRQGANFNFQANKPITSDANLISARQFEGQLQANNAQLQGFLADNKEIQRTQDRALQNRFNNIQIRNNVANKNTESIHNTNLQKAQLEASKLQKDWRGIDSFMAGTSQRIENYFGERDNIKENILGQQAQLKYEQALKPYQEELQTWATANPDADITSWPKYDEYKTAVEDAGLKFKKDMLNIKGSRYGININDFTI